MEHISSQTDNIVNMKSEEPKKTETIECLECHTKVEFSEKQYRRYCPKCGLSVSRKQERQKRENTKENNSGKCFICSDTGIIPYSAQIGRTIYQYVARCECPAGNRMGNAIPLITDCTMAPTIDFLKSEATT